MQDVVEVVQVLQLVLLLGGNTTVQQVHQVVRLLVRQVTPRPHPVGQVRVLDDQRGALVA